MADSIMSSYYEKNRFEILEFIQSSPKHVLDVGCGAGFFGELVKKKYECYVAGIEIEPDIAKIAKDKLDTVYTEKLENIITNQGFGLKFDLITLNDVIEHMPDPFSFLLQLKTVMQPNGKVVSSIPNFLYVDNVYEVIIKKDFCYRGAGILDKTHLRFYTAKSIRRLFEEAGYNIDRISPLNYNKSFKWKLFDRVTFGVFFEFLVYQYAIVASPRS